MFPSLNIDLIEQSFVPDAGSRQGKRVMCNLTAVAFEIAHSSIATCYPEAMFWWRLIIAA